MRVRSNRTRTSVRLIVGLALVGSVTLVAALPASADHCSGQGQIDDRGGDVAAECHGQSPGQPGGRTVNEAWDIYCAGAVGPFEEGDEVEFYGTDQLSPEDVAHLGFDPTGEYWWWNVTCWRDGAEAHSSEFAVEVTAPVPPEEIRDVATARLEPPSPAPQTSPPIARQTFVRVATWLWLDPASWTPIEVTETQGLTSVTVRATPTGAVWSMGDGEEVTCSGPGLAWTSGAAEDATDCSYTYEHSSYGEPGGRFAASVTVTWVFEWWINGVAQGGFGSVDVSASFPMAVAEIQAVETGG